MQTVKGVKVRCIKLLKNKVYKFARYKCIATNQEYITSVPKSMQFKPVVLCSGKPACRTFVTKIQKTGRVWTEYTKK